MDNRFESQSKKKSTLWLNVAAKINSVYPLKLRGADCHCKWRNLIGTYRKICSRLNETGENSSSWPYYKLMDGLYGSKSIDQTSNTDTFLQDTGEEDELDSSCKYWVQSAVKILIKTRIEMEEKFQNPHCKRYVLWNDISKKVNEVIHTGTVSGTECNVKWRNLKRTYRLLYSRIKGTPLAKPNWPYFKAFHDFYGDLSIEKPLVEMEVSFNEHHGYVFKVLPTNVTGENHNSTTLQQMPSPNKLSSDSQPTKNQDLRRLLSELEEEVSEPSKVCPSNRDDQWLKLMLLDWKKERKERWEEKKKIEREKITAVNNLTKAILSLERKGS